MDEDFELLESFLRIAELKRMRDKQLHALTEQTRIEKSEKKDNKRKHIEKNITTEVNSLVDHNYQASSQSHYLNDFEKNISATEIEEFQYKSVTIETLEINTENQSEIIYKNLNQDTYESYQESVKEVGYDKALSNPSSKGQKSPEIITLSRPCTYSRRMPNNYNPTIIKKSDFPIHKKSHKVIITSTIKRTSSTIKNRILKKALDAQRKPKSIADSKNLKVREMCEICGRLYTKENLKYHMNIHYNISPYGCEYPGCEKSFTSPSMLKQHKHFHSKFRRHICDICSKGFYMGSSLRNHRLLHFEPQFQCPDCGKMIHTQCKLNRHINVIHRSVKKFVCNICDKTYSGRQSLIKHQLNFHK